MIIAPRRRGIIRPTPYPPSFAVGQYSKLAPSIAAIPEVTVNAVAPTLSLEFLGGSALAAGWAERNALISALTLQAGTAPTYGVTSPLIENCVLGNGGGYFLSGNNDDGNVSTLDVLLRLFVKVVASKVVFAKRAAGVGYVVGFDATPALYCTIQDASGSATVVSAALVAGTWIFADVAINRDDATMGGQCYVDGAASGSAVDCSGRALTLDAAVALALLANSSGASQFTSHLGFVGIYGKTAWFRAGATGAADILAAHARDFAAITQSAPRHSASGVASPTAKGSTSPAYINKVETGQPKIYFMGAATPRWKMCVDSLSRPFTGALVEAAATNGCGTSNGFTTWSLAGACNRTGGKSDPIGGLDAVRCAFVTDGLIYPAAINTGTPPANLPAVVAVWAKRISGGTQIYLGCTDATAWTYAIRGAVTVPDVWTKIYYAGTFGAAVGASIQPSIGIQANATLGQPALPDITVDLFMGHAELNTQYPSSGINVGAAAVTRAADVLYYALGAGDIGTAQFSFALDFLAPSFTPIRSHYLCAISDGGAATDALSLFIDTNGRLNLVTAATSGGSEAGSIVESSGSRCDNRIHRAEVYMRHNDLKLVVDGVLIGTDTACDFPAGLDRLHIGSDCAGANQAGPAIITGPFLSPEFSNHRWPQ